MPSMKEHCKCDDKSLKKSALVVVKKVFTCMHLKRVLLECKYENYLRQFWGNYLR
jgi:hypothetical protein